jgi:hypothetical protein
MSFTEKLQKVSEDNNSLAYHQTLVIADAQREYISNNAKAYAHAVRGA